MKRNRHNEKTVANDDLQAIGFTIGNEEYALPISVVKEVLNSPSITRVPLGPSYIRGVINLRGNIIPVMDIAARLGIGETSLGDDARIVAVEMPGETIAIAAESVSKVTRLSKSQINPPPRHTAGISSEYLDGVARVDDRFLIFLNVQRVLGMTGMENEEGTHAN